MRKMADFAGVYPALVSPVDSRGKVDEAALRGLVSWLGGTGIDGLYVCGGTGEGLLLPVQTRKRILEIVKDEAKSVAGNKALRIIAHIGAVESAYIAELAGHAASLDVDAVSAIPPIYFSYTKDDIVRYYEWLSGICEVPLIIYASAQAGVTFTADMLKTLAEQPMLRGIKFTGYDFYSLMQMRAAVSEDFTILNGGDEVLLYGMMAGADGGIGATYNIMPRQFCELYRAFQDSDMVLARQIQEKINAVVREIVRYPVFGSVKATLGLIGHEAGDPIFPNRTLTETEKGSLRRGLAAIGYPGDYL